MTDMLVGGLGAMLVIVLIGLCVDKITRQEGGRAQLLKFRWWLLGGWLCSCGWRGPSCKRQGRWFKGNRWGWVCPRCGASLKRWRPPKKLFRWRGM